MADETVGIRFVGHNQVSPTVQQINSDLRGLSGTVKGLDLFGALPGQLGSSLSRMRSMLGDFNAYYRQQMRQVGSGSGALNDLAALGVNEFSADFKALNPELFATAGAASKASAALGALTPIMVLGGVAAAGAALAIGKQAVELGTYGQAVEQTEKKFIAFAGGPQQAANAITAMRAATEGGMSDMDAMTYSAMLLSMGLAKNGDEAARLTRLATMLGPAYRDAATNVQDFTMLLANQSVRRLDQFGLSIDAVKAKQQALMATGMDSQMAFTNAVIEIGSQKLAQLEAAGVKATTSANALAAAWANLRAEVGKQLAPAVGDAQSGIAGFLTRQVNIEQSRSNQPADRFLGLSNMRIDLERQLAEANAFLDKNPANLLVRLRRDDILRQLAYILAEIGNTPPGKIGVEFSGDVGTNLENKFRGAASDGFTTLPDTIEAQGEIGIRRLQAIFASSTFQMNFSANMPQGPDAWGNGADWQRFNDYQSPEDQAAVIASVLEEQRRRASAAGVAQAAAQNQFYVDPTREFQDYGTVLQQAWQPAIDADLRERVNATAEATRATKKAWDDAASDAAKAWKDGIADVKSEFSKGMGVSRGLSDLTGTGGGGADDPNGWMQDIRRLQAWINDGSWGETAAKFGITSKEDATNRIRKFQTGQWDESVTALIDKQKLADQIKASGAATVFMDAFAAEVANVSGENPAVVKAMLGFQQDKNGKGAMDMKPMAQAISSSFATEVTTQSAAFVSAGNTLFSYVGQGFIDSAKSSGLLYQAVQQMVYSLVAPKK